MAVNRNVVGWFEIPVTDMDRAVAFYEAVFGFQLERHPMGELDMAWFPFAEGDAGGASGSLVKQAEFYTPGQEGSMVYFTAPSGDLANELSRVEAAGGNVMVPKTVIGEGHGFMAVFFDTEGNRVALHSRV
jgi:predicted enzyme related to lactoylglutathione lyase